MGCVWSLGFANGVIGVWGDEVWHVLNGVELIQLQRLDFHIEGVCWMWGVIGLLVVVKCVVEKL